MPEGRGIGGGSRRSFNLAAGLADHTGQPLFEFAEKTNSTTYFHRFGRGFIPERFYQLADEAEMINFNLRDFSFTRHIDWLKRGQPAEPERATSMELEYILSNPELRKKTNFFVYPPIEP